MLGHFNHAGNSLRPAAALRFGQLRGAWARELSDCEGLIGVQKVPQMPCVPGTKRVAFFVD